MRKFLMLFGVLLMLVGVRVGIGTGADEYEAVMVRTDIRAELLAFIREASMEPQEPRRDAVYEFVPGLHGLEIDFELSYANMLANGRFDESLVVGRGIPFDGNSEDFRQHVMYKGNEQGDYVALLINVAWGYDELNEMLDIMDELNVRATVFFEGRYARDHEAQVLDVFNRGHLIGNHSYSHPAAWGGFSYEQFEEEIVRTNDVLSGIIGEEIVFFAPPGGEFNDVTVEAAFNQGMYTILWSADTIDWRGDSASVMINRVMDRIGPGGLILTHPKPETVKALRDMVSQLRAEGYEFKTVDQIISGERLGIGAVVPSRN